eukprot:m.18237 g.18237  ORF g.18237 m.18237 type:complete len:203 (-) comp10776_c0_seq1:61-669(-)
MPASKMAATIGVSSEERFAAVMKGLSDGTKYKEEGNAALKAGEIKTAMQRYHFGHLSTRSAITMVDNSAQKAMSPSASSANSNPSSLLTHADENFRALASLHISLLNNLTVVMIKLERWEKAVTYSSDALKMDPDNSKALMRRAKAYIKLKKLHHAATDVEKGLQGNPEDPELKRMRTYLDQVEAHYDAKQKQAMRGWVDKM